MKNKKLSKVLNNIKKLEREYRDAEAGYIDYRDKLEVEMSNNLQKRSEVVERAKVRWVEYSKKTLGTCSGDRITVDSVARVVENVFNLLEE